MLFSMARERTLPFSNVLGTVSKRTGTPIGTTVVVGAGAAIALAVNWNSVSVFLALSSICIAMLYLAYLGVTVPLLVKRLRGGLPSGTDEFGRPLFSLGRAGIAINAVAIVYQVAMAVNLAWPRAEIYDPAGESWVLQWSAPLFILLVLLVGVVVHWRNRVRHGGAVVLGSLHHSAEPVDSPAAS
jgi:amino acid transporter